MLVQTLAIVLGFAVEMTVATTPIETGFCVTTHCLPQTLSCVGNKKCHEALDCNRKCGTGPSSPSCNLLCSLTSGYENAQYKNLLRCMTAHKCLPATPPDGICKAKKSDGLKDVTSLDSISGIWWILKGLNCGQKGWPSGFDYFPCQSDQFYKVNGEWKDRIEYCGGTNSTCSTPIVHTFANVTISQPGVLFHSYTDPPLQPQTEDWILLSRPHPDWMLYVYCGETPNGVYAGASVVSRTAKNINLIPKDIEAIFKKVAHEYDFSYDEMCITDATTCLDQPLMESGGEF